MKRDDDNVENFNLHIPTICVMASSPTSVNERKLLTGNDLKRAEGESIVTDDDRSDMEDEFEVLEVTPDGGWGWIVTIASFFSNAIVDGVCYTFGLLYAELLDEFNAGRSKTALIGSLVVGTYLMIGSSHVHISQQNDRFVPRLTLTVANPTIFNSFPCRTRTLILTVPVSYSRLN